MPTPDKPRVPLSQRVREATDAAIALLRTTDGGADEVERLRAARSERPSVVVVGETKRGKSSLINALLDAPGLSPVDPDVATSAYLVFRSGKDIAARALVPGADQLVPIPVADLRDWATVLGSLPEDQPPPRMIDVESPAPLLRNITLVDTPGVGGLDAAHGEIALAAVREATALLFVVDASSPFTAPELDFLDKASQAVDLVLFAVTKIDAYRGWRQVVEDDRALLAEYAPRFADAEILPVSAALFERAASLEGELAATLRTESQVIGLRMMLQTKVAAKSAALRDANVLRAARTGLAARQRALESELAGIDPEPGRAEELKANRERLRAARRQDGRAWQLGLRAAVSRARLDTMHDAQREIRDQLHYWRASIDRADAKALRRLPAELDAVVNALGLRVSERMLSRLATVTDTTLRDLFKPDELVGVYAGFAHGPGVASRLTGPDKRGVTSEDRLVVASGAMMGVGASRIVVLAGAAALPAAVMLPISIGLGLLASGWLVRMRRQSANKNHYKTWVSEALTEVRANLENEIASQFLDAEQSLTLALDEAIARRVEELDTEIGKIDEALRMDAREKDKRRKEIGAGLALARQSIDRIDALLPALRAATPTARVSAAALARAAVGAVSPSAFQPRIAGPGPAEGDEA